MPVILSRDDATNHHRCDLRAAFRKFPTAFEEETGKDGLLKSRRKQAGTRAKCERQRRGLKEAQ